jgi:hypothetical protein
MYWLVHAKRHDNDFDVSLFLLAKVHKTTFKTINSCDFVLFQILQIFTK